MTGMENHPMKLPRFTLRDLFWLVLVCALAVGWWVNYRESNALRIALAEIVRDKDTLLELT